MAITLDIYSHVLSSLQEAAAHQFEEGLQDGIPETQVTEVGENMVIKFAQ